MTDKTTPTPEAVQAIIEKLRRFAVTGRERQSHVVINSYHAETLDEAADMLTALSQQPASVDLDVAVQRVEQWLSNLQITKGSPIAGDYFSPEAIDIIEEAVRPLLTSLHVREAALRRLVIAARKVAFEAATPDALRELDQASEAFAADVPWEDQP